MHWRSDDALGATLSCQPAAHVLIARHKRSECACGASYVYWPLGHAALWVAHVRSDDADAALVSHSFVLHWRAGLHEAPSATSEYVTPVSQTVHVRSCVGVPSSCNPLPSWQRRHAMQLELPALTVYLPGSHEVHIMSVVGVAAVAMRSPAAHG